jgi:NADH-quinone oxidoreductase subunit F
MKGLDGTNWGLKAYQERGGYKAIRKIVDDKLTPRRGDRGGEESRRCAGAAARASPRASSGPSCRRTSPARSTSSATSDEGEPGTFKDRDIIRYNPHALIEGMMIAGYSIGATVGYNYIHGEDLERVRDFSRRPSTKPGAAGFLGQNILGGGFDFDLFRPPRLRAPTSAARRRRCSSRSRARRASRASSRRSPRASASTASPPRSTTPRPSPRSRTSS